MSNVTANSTLVRVYRLVFGLLIFAAVIYQLTLSSNWGNFFSFFTIQSNIIAGVVLLIGATQVPKGARNWDVVRGGAAIYMILTGVVYNTLLRGLDEQLQTSEPWVNLVLHQLIPVVMLLDFILIPLVHKLRPSEALVWTVYPLLYLVYSLARGPIVDWYPYPFLDPRGDGGYLQVAIISVIILVGFIAVTWLFTRYTNWRLREHSLIHPA